MAKKPSWKPVRRGSIYCSPACGGQCTHAAFLAAERQSKAEAKKLGKGWKPDVSENLGWHWRVVSKCGRLKVSLFVRKDYKQYTALLGEASSPGGKWVGHGKTSAAAVKDVLKTAREDIAWRASLVAGL